MKELAVQTKLIGFELEPYYVIKSDKKRIQ